MSINSHAQHASWRLRNFRSERRLLLPPLPLGENIAGGERPAESMTKNESLDFRFGRADDWRRRASRSGRRSGSRRRLRYLIAGQKRKDTNQFKG